MGSDPMRQLIEQWWRDAAAFERNGFGAHAMQTRACADQLESLLASLPSGEEEQKQADTRVDGECCKRGAGSTASGNELTRGLDRINYAIAQREPWDYYDPPSQEYRDGYNAASDFYTRVLVAAEHGLWCGSCGMPSHRGAGYERLNALLRERYGLPPAADAVDPSAADTGKPTTRVSESFSPPDPPQETP